MKESMRIVVIGAGVIGCSLAWRLAEAGQQVTIVERASLASGATGSTFAWLNANQKTPEDYYELNLAGMRAHRRLRDDIGAPWLHETGNLMWHTPDQAERSAEIEERVARLQRWGYAAEWIGRDDVHRLEPNLTVEPEVEHVAWFPDEAWVDGPALARKLCALAEQHGATNRFASEVVAIERGGGQVSGVRLADGTRIPADVVVNCAGPAAAKVARLVGRELPMEARPGLIIRLANADGLIQRTMHAPRIHMRPDADGLVMIHKGDADEALVRGEPAGPWISQYIDWAVSYVPGFREARIAAWSVGVRPIPEDGRSSAGLLPSIPGYAEVVTHSGITLGPLLGELVARQIVAGETDPLLAPFSPERFA
jgi:glycine/D-amino acid oxidase-like deaminating enzyme